MRLKKRIGKNKAIVAMARKLSVVICNTLAKGQDFVEMQAFQKLYERKINNMGSKAKGVEKIEANYVQRLIAQEVIRLQSNKLLS